MFVDGDLCFRNNLYKVRDRIIFTEYSGYRNILLTTDYFVDACILFFFLNALNFFNEKIERDRVRWHFHDRFQS